MSEQPIPKILLIRLSILSCIISILVFAYFLFQESFHKAKQAKAYLYTSDQVIVAVNEERKKAGLEPLIINEQLMQAAQMKAEDMNNKNYFSHISPVDGTKWSDFIKKSGYEYSIAGENLANGFTEVGAMVKAWMNSPSHRENILNTSVRETGVSVLSGKLNNYPTIFVVQVFGKQMTKEQVAKMHSLEPEAYNLSEKETKDKDSRQFLGQRIRLKTINYPLDSNLYPKKEKEGENVASNQGE